MRSRRQPLKHRSTPAKALASPLFRPRRVPDKRRKLRERAERSVGMVDPDRLTNYSRTDAQLQELWLFSIAVAGKPAFRIARQVSRFVAALDRTKLPFDGLKKVLAEEGYGSLYHRVLDAKFGQHTRIAKAFSQSINLNLRTATLDELMVVHGVGPKTARMFLLHSRRSAGPRRYPRSQSDQRCPRARATLIGTTDADYMGATRGDARRPSALGQDTRRAGLRHRVEEYQSVMDATG
jgi:hypothetical protein